MVKLDDFGVPMRIIRILVNLAVMPLFGLFVMAYLYFNDPYWEAARTGLVFFWNIDKKK